MNISVKEDMDPEKAREDCLRFLASHRVDVGLTSSASPRSRMLLAIHEHGAPSMRIPARPVIEPALSAPRAREEIASALAAAVSAAWAGKQKGVDAALAAAGEAGVAAIHACIDAGVPPPNSPVTVSGGWVYNRTAKKGVRIEGKGFDKPLFDTGQLYNDFDYEVASKS